MPFGNEASDFAKAFTGMLSFGMQLGEYQQKKELLPLQKEELETGIAATKQGIEASKGRESRETETYTYTKGRRSFEEQAAQKQLDIAVQASNNAQKEADRAQDAFEFEKSERGKVSAKTQADLDTANFNLDKAKKDQEYLEKVAQPAGEKQAAATLEETGVRTEAQREELKAKKLLNANNALAQAIAQENLVAQARGEGVPEERIQEILKSIESVSPKAKAAEGAGGSGATRGLLSPEGQVNQYAGKSEQAIPTQDASAPAEPTASVEDQAIPTETSPEPETPSLADTAPAGKSHVIQAQSGTRKLPLNDQTNNMLESAAMQSGLIVRVKSGAQPSSGPHRTGSHRHDEEVGAADIELIDPETGKRLSSEVPAERIRIQEFMKAAQGAGATGFGAGREYMGDFTFHVGFGAPAIWGSDKTSKTAPDWLVATLGGGGSPNAAIPVATRSAAGPATTGSVTPRSNLSPYVRNRPPVLDMASRAGAGGAGGASRDMVGPPAALPVTTAPPSAAAPTVSPTAATPAAAPTTGAETPPGKDIGPLVQATEGAAPPSQAGQMMQAKLTDEDRAAINDTANALGIAPSALAAVIGYETKGTFDPAIQGGKGGEYSGVIQFSPEMQQRYGVTPNMSFADQVRGPVSAYLKDRGLPPGSGLAEIYSVINAGSLNADGTPRWDASDGNATVRQHVGRISQEFMPAAEAMFGGPVPLSNLGAGLGAGLNEGQGPTINTAKEMGVTPRPSAVSRAAIPTDVGTPPKPETIEKAKIPKQYIDSGQYAVDGVTAAKATVKAIYAGVTQNAVPTQQSQGQLRQIVSGDGGADPKAMRDIHEGVQRGLDPKAKVSLAQRNLLSIGTPARLGKYNPATGTFEPDAKYQQDVTYQIYQNYKATANQFMSIAQMKAQTGNLDEAAKITLKADAYITDGNEVTDFNQNKDGTYTMKIKNLVSGEEQTLDVTPQQMYAKIMGYNSTIDFDRRIAASAGVNLPSSEMEAYSAYAQNPPTEAPPRGNVPVAEGIPTLQGAATAGAKSAVGRALAEPMQPNYAALGEADVSGGQAPKGEPVVAKGMYENMVSARNKQQEKLAKPFTVKERDDLNDSIEAAWQTFGPKSLGAKGSSIQADLTETFQERPNDLNAIVMQMARANPDVPIQTILSDLHTMTRVDNPMRRNYVVTEGEDPDMITLQATDDRAGLSPIALQVPWNTAMTLVNAVERRATESAGEFDVGRKAKEAKVERGKELEVKKAGAARQGRERQKAYEEQARKAREESERLQQGYTTLPQHPVTGR